MNEAGDEPDLEELLRVDAFLFELSRGRGRTRLRIGSALAKLGAGFHELGFSELGAYARQRASRSAAWARESMRLAKRLDALPSIRAALEGGEIGWSMAELCARHVMPEQEAEVLELARERSVAAMRAMFRARAAVAGDAARARDEEGEVPREHTLSLRVDVEDAWALQATKWLVRHMDGSAASGAGPDGWLDSLLGEGQTTLLELGAGRDADLLPEDIVAEHARWVASIEAGLERAARAEAAAEPWLPLGEVEAGVAREDEPLPDSPRALDRVVRDLCAELASREVCLGRALLGFFAQRGHQHLGYATDTQYARERLGMSRSAMRGIMTLAQRAGSLRRVEHALQNGELGVAQAALVTRIATQKTEAAWLERAARRTYKHLREDVEAAEMLARLLGREPTPPDEVDTEVVQHLERSVLSGEYVRELVTDLEAALVPVQISDTATATVPVTVPANDTAAATGTVPVQISDIIRRRGTVEVRLRLREDVALHFRQLEEAHRRAGSPGGTFVWFLCFSFFRTWAEHLGQSDRWEMTYRRDLYRCTSPVCDRRDRTAHHVKYRGRGGGHQLENTTSPCPFCHLDGEHGGRLRVRGFAPFLTWWIGREPILRVRGRELEWAA